MKIHAATATAVLLASLSALHAPAIAQTGVKKYEAQEIQKAQELRRKKEAFERAEIQRQQNLRKNRAAYEAGQLAAQKALNSKFIGFATNATQLMRSFIRICDGRVQYSNPAVAEEMINFKRPINDEDIAINYKIDANYATQEQFLNDNLIAIATIKIWASIRDINNIYFRQRESGIGDFYISDWGTWDKYYENYNEKGFVNYYLVVKLRQNLPSIIDLHGHGGFYSYNYRYGEAPDLYADFIRDGSFQILNKFFNTLGKSKCWMSGQKDTEIINWVDELLVNELGEPVLEPG